MKVVAVIVGLVLSLSLMVQNTCPHGYAGKTSVVRTCGRCPHKPDQVSMKTVKMEQTVKKQSSHPPLFVLAFQDAMISLQPAPHKTASTFLQSRYQDAEPYELLRPPHA